MSDPSASKSPGRRHFTQLGVNALASVGNVVLVWNELEHQMQILVSWFSGNTWETFVSTTRFHRDGSLATRLEKLSGAPRPDAHDAIIQFARGFDRLREHRNRLVHHFRHVIEGATEAKVILHAAGAKGVAFSELTIAEMMDLVGYTIDWGEFGRQIMMRYTVTPGSPSPTLPPLDLPALPPAVQMNWQKV